MNYQINPRISPDRFILFNYVIYNNIDYRFRFSTDEEESIFKQLVYEYKEVKNGDDVSLRHFDILLSYVLDDDLVHFIFNEIATYNNMKLYHLLIEFYLSEMELYREISPYILDEIKVTLSPFKHKFLPKIIKQIKVYKLAKWRHLQLNRL